MFHNRRSLYIPEHPHKNIIAAIVEYLLHDCQTNHEILSKSMVFIQIHTYLPERQSSAGCHVTYAGRTCNRRQSEDSVLVKGSVTYHVHASILPATGESCFHSQYQSTVRYKNIYLTGRN